MIYSNQLFDIAIQRHNICQDKYIFFLLLSFHPLDFTFVDDGSF